MSADVTRMLKELEKVKLVLAAMQTREQELAEAIHKIGLSTQPLMAALTILERKGLITASEIAEALKEGLAQLKSKMELDRPKLIVTGGKDGKEGHSINGD